MEKTTAYRRKTAEQRQAELIEAGITCLGRGGMAAFTIDQICTEGGVSRGLINHHFSSKEALLLRIYEEMTAHLLGGDNGADPVEDLGEIIETSFDDANFNRSNLRAWLSIWGQVAVDPALNDLHQRRYEHYKARIERGIAALAQGRDPPLDCEAVARQLIALIDGLWLEYCLHSEGFSLGVARQDCYRFLGAYGIRLESSA